MIKYKTVVEYDGTAYHGWQLQIRVPSVQGAIEQVLGLILMRPTRVHGAGRTDAGVHATGQVAHFSADWKYSPMELQRACNSLLPPDIVLKSLGYCAEDFHARHSAKSKTYSYMICNRPLRSPLIRLYSWHIYHQLDIELMNEASGNLEGTHDFATFGSPTDGTPSTVRQILEARWIEGFMTGVLRFTIRGSGFLRYMVRSLVGSLVLVGRRKITSNEFLMLLESCDRSRSGPTAPAHGLCLEAVDY